MEISDLRNAVKSETDTLRGEITGLRSEISDMRAEMHTRIDGLRTEMGELRSEVRRLSSEIHKDFRSLVWIIGLSGRSKPLL